MDLPGGGVANWPLWRRLLPRFGNLYTRTLLRLPVHDCTAGFLYYTREVIESVDPFSILSPGYAFLEEMLWRVHRCGFRIVGIPIVFEDRARGDSKIDQREIYRAVWQVLHTAFQRPPARRSARRAQRRQGAARVGGLAAGVDAVGLPAASPRDGQSLQTGQRASGSSFKASASLPYLRPGSQAGWGALRPPGAASVSHVSEDRHLDTAGDFSLEAGEEATLGGSGGWVFR